MKKFGAIAVVAVLGTSMFAATAVNAKERTWFGEAFCWALPEICEAFDW